MQVLSNLLTNAIQYAPDNSVIEVTLQHQDSSALITVSDRGCEFPSASLTRYSRNFNSRSLQTKENAEAPDLAWLSARQLSSSMVAKSACTV
jgi:signal transduction histidine kinase